MTREGLSMRKVREILRLRFEAGLTTREVAQPCKVSCGTVSEYGIRFREAGLGWPLPEDMDDAILAALRNRTFFSLTEIDQAIGELLDKLNSRKFKRIDATRQELFEQLDKPALGPLPPSRYYFGEWKTAKVAIDYHIALDKHLYSVPFPLVGVHVEARLTATTVEILHKNQRIATHIRSYVAGGVTTNPDHRPPSHQKHLEWTPERISSWAATKGPRTGELVRRIIESRVHPEQAYRSCLGIIRFTERFTCERVEAACARALKCNAISYKSIKSIIDKGLDKLPLKDAPEYIPIEHANIPGYRHWQAMMGATRTMLAKIHREMADSVREQLANPTAASLSFEDRLALAVDRQWDLKENRAPARRLYIAKLKQKAAIEDIDFRAHRGLDKGV